MIEQKNTPKIKEFLFSSWAIEHKTVIYVIMTLFFILGISSYFTMPREAFPEINDTKVFVSAVYPGNTAEDIERIITDPLEEALKGVPNLVEIRSTSSEDFSVIDIELDENITIDDAKQKVKELVDGVTSGPDWPVFNNAKVEPNVFELDFSELQPILNISLIGNYPIKQLKVYAERLENRIEQLPQIKEVNIRGIQIFEVEVAVDIYKMTAAKVSFNDILGAISQENSTISSGNIVMGGQRRNIRLTGEIENPQQLRNFVVKTDGGPVYLGDLAEISFKEKENGHYLIELKGLIRFEIINEIKSKKKYRECEVNFKRFHHDLNDDKEQLKFSDLELIFKDLKTLFEKRGFIINWKELEKQSLDETINALAMASPFTIEEKQVLLEAENLNIRKNKIADILSTYTYDVFDNTTLQ